VPLKSEARDELVDLLEHPRRLQGVEEEGRVWHEQQRPRDSAQRCRSSERRRNAYEASERLLRTDGGRLREEKEEAAPKAPTERRLLQRKGILVERARDAKSERPGHPRGNAAAGERCKDGTAEEAMDEQVPTT